MLILIVIVFACLTIYRDKAEGIYQGHLKKYIICYSHLLQPIDATPAANAIINNTSFIVQIVLVYYRAGKKVFYQRH